MLPGDPSVPIIYEVDRIRDGKSFATRRVVAIQHGKAIFSMSCSFQIAEEGLDHQIPMPEVPPPEELPSEAELEALFLDAAPGAGAPLLGAGAADRDPARSIFATTSAASRWTRARASGSGRPGRCPTIPTSTAACSPMPRT